jgi:hypothetical protein
LDERKSTQGTNKTLMSAASEPCLHVPSFRSGIGLAGCPEQGLLAALGRYEEFKHMYVCVWKISGDALALLWEQPTMDPCFGGGRAVFLPGQTALLPTLLFVTNWDARRVCIVDAHFGQAAWLVPHSRGAIGHCGVWAPTNSRCIFVVVE